MKREVFQTPNIYPKTIISHQPTFISNQPEISFHFRQQKSPFTHHHHNRPNPPFCPPPFQRYSQDVLVNNQPPSNNAFVHLRNQISNLRSQFSKLIQKDNVKVMQRPIVESREKERKDTSANKRENRMQTYSTIGFYNKVSQHQKKQHHDHNPKTILQQTSEYKSYIFDKNNSDSTNHYSKLDDKNKYLAKSYLQHHQSLVPSLETTKIQDLQREIIRINEIRHKAEQTVQQTKKQLNTKQAQFSRQLSQKEAEISQLQQTIDQDKISLSLKNSLVQKLQRQISKLQAQKTYLVNESNFHEQELKKQRQKYESQLSLAQQIHRINIAEIIKNYQQTQEQLQKNKQELTKINQILADKDKKLLRVEQNIRLLSQKVSLVQAQLQKEKCLSKEAYQRQFELKSKLTEIQRKYPSQQSKGQALTPEIASKLKIYQQQNTDLKKRVESYKKSIQQLNNTNNSSRQKLAKARQQVKALNDENKIKEALIGSLYRDISILDNEMRQIPILKALITANNKFIEDLNLSIIHLQCERANSKYQKRYQD